MTDEGKPLTIDMIDPMDLIAIQHRIETALASAVDEAGVLEKACPDVVARGLRIFRDMDQDGNFIAKNGDEILYDKDGVNPISIKGWLVVLRSCAPHLWPGPYDVGAQQGASKGCAATD